MEYWVQCYNDKPRLSLNRSKEIRGFIPLVGDIIYFSVKDFNQVGKYFKEHHFSSIGLVVKRRYITNLQCETVSVKLELEYNEAYK